MAVLAAAAVNPPTAGVGTVLEPMVICFDADAPRDPFADVKVTVNVPCDAHVTEGDATFDVAGLPFSKIQSVVSWAPLVLSWNVTVSPTLGLAGVQSKSATGATPTVVVVVLGAVVAGVVAGAAVGGGVTGGRGFGFDAAVGGATTSVVTGATVVSGAAVVVGATVVSTTGASMTVTVHFPVRSCATPVSSVTVAATVIVRSPALLQTTDGT
jgi:hypothetical protein